MRFICDYSIQQIKSINKGIYLIENEKTDNLPTDKQILLAKRWCKDYNIIINDRCIYLKN